DYTHHPVASLKSLRSGTDRNDRACDIVPKDCRQLQRDGLFEISAAQLPVHRVKTGGGDLNQHLASLGFRLRCILVEKLIHASVAVQQDCFHSCGSPFERRRPCITKAHIARPIFAWRYETFALLLGKATISEIRARPVPRDLRTPYHFPCT